MASSAPELKVAHRQNPGSSVFQPHGSKFFLNLNGPGSELFPKPLGDNSVLQHLGVQPYDLSRDPS